MRRQVNPKTAADTLRRASKLRARLAIVLGSGFQSVAQAMTVARAVPYAKLAGFPKPTVAGHTGKAIIGTLGGTEIVVLSGRAHYYEGHSLETVTFPIRVLAEYGIENILLTNAAGGINKKFNPGELMLLTDHLNFIGDNPLRGALTKGRERFIDLTQTYDPALNTSIQAAARKTKTKLHRGVYCALSGPSYETPAEIRALAKLGADAVGMSTVPEAIVARQCGLSVAALSCITNPAAGISKTPLSHAEVLGIGEQASTQAVKLITEFSAGKMPATH
ncbi:MAG: purine-nucleoside phosphorylase [Verrucomicrobia subdivision 3 bacterium]|nr:purine-nucleoside phosphorylase [Limisphaerales bacterium]